MNINQCSYQVQCYVRYFIKQVIMTTKAYAYLSDEKVVDFELSIRRLQSSTRLKPCHFVSKTVPD